MKERVMVVSVSADSFNSVKNKLIYCLPSDSPTKFADYLAFYQVKPISAISHYGKIAEIVSSAHYSNFFKDSPDWIKNNQIVKCYRLEWLKKLQQPIRRSQKYNAIMKPVYADFEILFSSKTLEDLFVK